MSIWGRNRPRDDAERARAAAEIAELKGDVERLRDEARRGPTNKAPVTLGPGESYEVSVGYTSDEGEYGTLTFRLPGRDEGTAFVLDEEYVFKLVSIRASPYSARP